MRRSLSILTTSTIVCLSALATHGVAQAQPAGVPPLQAQGNAKWVCGGIGSGQTEAFRGAQRNHPLSLVFANAQGEFYASVAFTVKNSSGAAVLSVPSTAGPICLIDIPAGRYTIEATAPGGKAPQTQTVDVGSAPRTVDFRL